MSWQKMPCGGQFDTESYCLSEEKDYCKECPSKRSNWFRKQLW